MNDKVETKQQDDDLETIIVTHERTGKPTRTFIAHERSFPAINKITAGLNHKDEAQQQQARERFSQNLIAACVTEDGKAITFDQVETMGAKLGKKLETAVLEVNGMTEPKKAEAKNA